MHSLLAELQPICSACDGIGAPRTPRCPSCGAPFPSLAGDAPAPARSEAEVAQVAPDAAIADPTAEAAPAPPAVGSETATVASMHATPAPLGHRMPWSEDDFHPGRARIVLLRGMGTSGAIYDLPPEGGRLGRSEGTIQLPDDTLPPLAASFVYRDGKLFVRDEGGPSGVLVRIRHQQALEVGAVFSLGDRLFRFGGVVTRPAPGAPGDAPIRLGSPLPADDLLRLETILLGGGAGRVYLLPSPLRIGRVTGDVLLADDPFVSGRHCALHLHEGEVILQDLGSSNGTFLRIPSGSEHQLRRGDTLRVGRNILRVE